MLQVFPFFSDFFEASPRGKMVYWELKFLKTVLKSENILMNVVVGSRGFLLGRGGLRGGGVPRVADRAELRLERGDGGRLESGV